MIQGTSVQVTFITVHDWTETSLIISVAMASASAIYPNTVGTMEQFGWQSLYKTTKKKSSSVMSSLFAGPFLLSRWGLSKLDRMSSHLLGQVFSPVAAWLGQCKHLEHVLPKETKHCPGPPDCCWMCWGRSSVIRSPQTSDKGINDTRDRSEARSRQIRLHSTNSNFKIQITHRIIIC